MRKILIAAAAFLAISAAAALPQGTKGWPDTTRLLTRERSQAKACVALLKSAGDKSAILNGQIEYDNAKAAADGVIAGLSTALVEGGKPQDFPTIQADMDEAGTGLQKVCDVAVTTARAAQGTKGVVDGIVTEAVKPLIDALKAAAGALWEHHIEMAKLEREMIEKQLEAAKWPEFGSP
jgi:hypothetical protein